MAANHEDQIMPQHFSFPDKLGKGDRIEGLTRRIEQNLFGCWVLCEGIETVWPDFRHAGGREVSGAANVFLGKSIGGSVFRLANEVKKQFHAGGGVISLPCVQRRSSP